MPAAPHLLVRADADVNMGSGHVMRCLALASAWRQRGGQATFLTSSNNATVLAQIAGEGHGLIQADLAHPDPRVIEQTVAALGCVGARCLAVDGYQFDQRFHAAIRSAGYHLLVIDDNAHLPYYEAAIVLNQNLHAAQLHYDCPASSRLLLGPGYALLRSEFANRSDTRRVIPTIARRILVTMGGSDAANITAIVIRALVELPATDVEAKVVIGPNNPHRAGLARLIRSSGGNIQLVTTAGSEKHTLEKLNGIQSPKSKIQNPTMSDLMAWADIAISAGGSTCWELAFMGLPAVLIVTADNQLHIARSLQAHGSVVNLGWHCNLTTTAIAAALGPLLANRHRRSMMSESGQLLVDGRGAARVADVLADVLMDGCDLVPVDGAALDVN